MTNRFLISVAAAALIASTGFANAQGAGGSMGQGGSGAAQHSGSGGAGGGAATQHDSGTKSGQSDGMKSGQSDKSGTVGQAPDKGGAGATTKGREDKGMTQGREGHDKSGTVGQGREDKGMTQGREGRDKSGTVGQSPDKSGTGATTQGREDKGMTQGREDRMNAPGRAQQNQGTTGAQHGTTGMAAGGPPPEKRTEIQSAIRSERIEDVGSNVNVNVAVGTRLPSSIRFHPLPSRIVEIYPEWRGYEVVLIKGRYVIVRPETHEIVYILES